ncbi:MAG: PDZ domain-containing protein [Luteolibacter sp.]|jgi:hypothetical protein|nr:PDZ domain-containing protein [Luteolibacter sp.]
MKALLVITFLLARAVSCAEDMPESPHPMPPPMPHEVPRAWLGLDVSKPDETITAHLPSLPPGIGFVIRSIDKDGPAAAAGLKELDILWKLGDQMLVNESQLATLLRLAKPGDEITLAGFRSGKPLDVTLKLGEAPASMSVFPGDLMDAAILPGECGGPMRVVNVAEKVASYSTLEGRAEVRRDGSFYQVKIQGPKDELIYEGKLPADGSLDKIPLEWKRRVLALRRGLDHTLDGRMMPSRQPRPRVVPPPGGKP